MTDFVQIIFTLAIILAAAKAGGYLSTRIGQPSVFGELLVGVILGPSLIDITHLSFMTYSHLGSFINELGEIGVLLLMFLAGLELHIKDLARNTKVAAISGTLGVLLPIVLGFLSARLFGFDVNASLFLGLTLAATSVSISAQTLMELGFLRSPVGLSLLGAAVFDDILVILMLSVVTALGVSGSGAGQILSIILWMIGYFILFMAAGVWGIPRLTRLVGKLPISQGIISYSLVVLLIFGIAAEEIGGMAAITGTFLAGLMFARTKEKEKIEEGLKPIAYGFFVPIFFISIGLKINLREFDLSSLSFLLVILVIAVISKVLGAGLGARLAGFPWLESYQLGIGMMSRGEVGLIVASIGAGLGLVNNTELTIIVITVLVTTLVTPILLKSSFVSPPAFLLPKPVKVLNQEKE
ncbi:MAG: cation:proton antiporter [Anaerolineaceae bacterium]